MIHVSTLSLLNFLCRRVWSAIRNKSATSSACSRLLRNLACCSLVRSAPISNSARTRDFPVLRDYRVAPPVPVIAVHHAAANALPRQENPVPPAAEASFPADGGGRRRFSGWWALASRELLPSSPCRGKGATST